MVYLSEAALLEEHG